MSTTLGGVTLANPIYNEEGSAVEVIDVGGTLTMADGSIVQDYITTRYRWKIGWRGLTAAEFATIKTQAEVRTAQVFSPPEEATEYTVVVVLGSWRYDSFETGSSTPYFNCELQLEEVA
jgi:hypothetical protein